ncbi:DUF2264 domain-containing protein [Termitidicoccus mucosus]|uniref:DUF2264 domain-containing protein n=1 Tax=Termitidicoccus mucosus TaxID=1184151 RepID=A0A178IM63_9BACT|nr:hypothetical protein AW736_00960 [Opitutaceae bacterium TSB47]
MKCKSALLCLLLPFIPVLAAQTNDRQAWADLAYKIAEPVLRNMAEGKLVQNMPLELSPTWDGRDRRVAYMETFGRLMMGIAPWLALPDDDTPEGVRRKQLRQWALKACAHAVNPDSPDYLLWRSGTQPLVDAAFLASSFLRAPAALWEPLDAVTKQRYIEEFTQMRRVTPGYSNWMLFSSTIEAFLLSIDAPHDFFRIRMGLAKIEEWYVGDGWYSDGPHFAFDYYNSFVIQPMYLEVLEVLVAKKARLANVGFPNAAANLAAVQARMRRHAEILERLVSPEGSIPPFGRSLTYRLAVFQPLSLLAWKEQLPASLPEGQVRAAITAVMRRMFAHPDNFTPDGFLRLGFVGHQPGMSDIYTNNGSLYLTSVVFLPLGLPAAHTFWTSPAEPWTAQKAWSGQPFPKDKKISGDNLPAAQKN